MLEWCEINISIAIKTLSHFKFSEGVGQTSSKVSARSNKFKVQKISVSKNFYQNLWYKIFQVCGLDLKVSEEVGMAQWEVLH